MEKKSGHDNRMASTRKQASKSLGGRIKARNKPEVRKISAH